MQKTGIAVAIVLCLAQAVYSENLPNLQIVGEEVKVAGSESSCWITLGIENTGTQNSLLSWQVVLQIVPVGNAPSNAFFNDLPMPADYTPIHYVFDDSSFGIGRSDVTPHVTSFSDMVLNGVEVPSSGKNLLRLNLTSPDAVGTYDIVLAPYSGPETGSYWLDNYWGAHAFDVAPPPERPDDVVATVVFSAIPEPPSGLMLLSGVVAMTLLGVVCRRHSPHTGPFCCRTRPVKSFDVKANRFP